MKEGNEYLSGIQAIVPENSQALHGPSDSLRDASSDSGNVRQEIQSVQNNELESQLSRFQADFGNGNVIVKSSEFMHDLIDRKLLKFGVNKNNEIEYSFYLQPINEADKVYSLRGFCSRKDSFAAIREVRKFLKERKNITIFSMTNERIGRLLLEPEGFEKVSYVECKKRIGDFVDIYTIGDVAAPYKNNAEAEEYYANKQFYIREENEDSNQRN